MAAQPSVPAIWRIELPNENATRQLAADVADLVGPQDLITLSGDIGSGKTTFARALIRRFADDPELEVPSPTFTLMQIYETGRFPIVHADLYRITAVEELAGLGWEEAAEGALVLVEWAHKAFDTLSPDRLDIGFTFDPAGPEGARVAVLRGYGTFAAILARAKAIHQLLAGCGWFAAKRVFMQGDASTRAYERLHKADGTSAVLMISPARTNEPVIRFGKSYRAIARLADTILPFIAMAGALRGLGLSAPQIYGQDRAAGLALIEDLGGEGVVGPQGPIAERYGAAVDVLAYLHRQSLPDSVPLEGSEYRIPVYDLEALTIEIEVMPDWYLPHIAGVSLSSGARATFVNLWRSLFAEILVAPPTWTLRDFHSPNLIWLVGREGLAKLGLIDFQDCVLGHPAYDLVSLLQDARIDVPNALEMKLLGDYVRQRQVDTGAFDVGAFARAYAILGAQRATKVLGIFARLDKRDRKPHYLGHIPRIERNLRKDLDHPALADLRDWYAMHLPKLFESQEPR